MTVYSVISLPKLPYIHRIYMVLANPSNKARPALCIGMLYVATDLTGSVSLKGYAYRTAPIASNTHLFGYLTK
jgi:hypothetical protein